MLEERSAGAVIFSKDMQFLLLKYGSGHWDFVKGNIEEEESEIETVLREIEEETSIPRSKIEIIPPFQEKIEYFYRRARELVHKEVLYYLAKSSTKRVKLSYEHQDYAWLYYDFAQKRVTYDNSKRILERAYRSLISNLT
jgi:8-oxo-dGTP pyrophosphatase MutT (NUDIX family)